VTPDPTVNAELKATNALRQARRAVLDAERDLEVAQRSPGYYWVIWRQGDDPCVAEWSNSGCWNLPGWDETFVTSELYDVYPTRIEPPE
jgi:hypothetical protein